MVIRIALTPRTGKASSFSNRKISLSLSVMIGKRWGAHQSSPQAPPETNNSMGSYIFVVYC